MSLTSLILRNQEMFKTDCWRTHTQFYTHQTNLFMKSSNKVLEINRWIGMLIYIGRYSDVANVSHRLNSADIYRKADMLQLCFIFNRLNYIIRWIP